MSAQSAKKVGVAVWGLGRHARDKLLPALTVSDRASLVGVYTRDAAVRAGEAQRYGCRAFESETAMLADSAVDAVAIATPNALHKEHTLAAINAGKHVWCEKPLACSAADAEAMVDAARRRGVVLGEMLMYVRHGQFRKVRELIRDGAVGPVRSIASRIGMPHWAPDNVRYRADLGGGALLDAAIYPLSFAAALAGSSPECVRAWVARDPIRGVDVAGAALLGFPESISAVAEWAYGRFYRNEAEVWGVDGVLMVPQAFGKPPNEPSHIIVRTRAGEHVIDCPAENAFGATFAEFVAAIEDDGARICLATAAVERVRLLDAVRAAA